MGQGLDKAMLTDPDQQVAMAVDDCLEAMLDEIVSQEHNEIAEQDDRGCLTYDPWEHCRNADQDGYFEIHRAAAAGDAVYVRRILDAGGWLTFANDDEKQGFFADADQVCKVREGFDDLGDFDSKNYRVAVNVTPLDLAVFYGHIDVVQELLTEEVELGSIPVASSRSKIAGTTNALYLTLQEGHTEVACLLLEESGELDRELFFEHIDPGIALDDLTMAWCIPRLIPGVPVQTDSKSGDAESTYELYRPLMAVEPQSLDTLLNSEMFQRLLGQGSTVFSRTVCIQVVSAAIARMIGLYQSTVADMVHLNNAVRRIPRLLAILADHGYICEEALLGVYDLATFQPRPMTQGAQATTTPAQAATTASPDSLNIHRQDRRKILEALAMFGVRPTEILFEELFTCAVEEFLREDIADRRRECCQLVRTIASVSVIRQGNLGVLQDAIGLFQDNISQNRGDVKLKQEAHQPSMDRMTRELIEFLLSLHNRVSLTQDPYCYRGYTDDMQTHTPGAMLSGIILRARQRKLRPTPGSAFFPYGYPFTIAQQQIIEQVIEPMERLFPWFGHSGIIKYLADLDTYDFLSIPPVEVIHDLAEGDDDRPYERIPKNPSG